MWCPERGRQAVVGKSVLRVRGDAVGMLCGTQIWYAGVLGMCVLGKSLVGKSLVGKTNVVPNETHRRVIPTEIKFTS